MNQNKALLKVAKKYGISIEEVKQIMYESILGGYHSKDPKVQKLWALCPKKGDVPTLEEALDFMTTMADSIE